MIFYKKILLVQNHCGLDSIKQIDLVDGNRYLVLFDPEKYGGIYNRIRYPIIVKSGFTYLISHNMQKSKMLHIIFASRETFCIML